jgi:hypothetical protein
MRRLSQSGGGAGGQSKVRLLMAMTALVSDSVTTSPSRNSKVFARLGVLAGHSSMTSPFSLSVKLSDTQCGLP